MKYNFLKQRTSTDILEDTQRVHVIMGREGEPVWFTADMIPSESDVEREEVMH